MKIRLCLHYPLLSIAAASRPIIVSGVPMQGPRQGRAQGSGRSRAGEDPEQWKTQSRGKPRAVEDPGKWKIQSSGRSRAGVDPEQGKIQGSGKSRAGKDSEQWKTQGSGRSRAAEDPEQGKTQSRRRSRAGEDPEQWKIQSRGRPRAGKTQGRGRPRAGKNPGREDPGQYWNAKGSYEKVQHEQLRHVHAKRKKSTPISLYSDVKNVLEKQQFALWCPECLGETAVCTVMSRVSWRNSSLYCINAYSCHTNWEMN